MTHTRLNGVALVERLARMGLLDRGPLDPGQPGQSARPAAHGQPVPWPAPSFVDGLEQWLGWTDAIALAAALQAGGAASGPGRPDQAASDAIAAARQAHDRVRTALARSIERDPLCPSDTTFGPFRRRCEALQRAMDAAIAPLRSQVRDAVAGLSPALARLAAIDAVLHGALQAREHTLLARLPGRLEPLFTRALPAEGQGGAATAQGLPDAAPPGEAAAPSAASAKALQPLRRELRLLLLDELALRLQPVQGLLAAAAHHHTPRDT